MRSIEIKYLAATNTKPSRLAAVSGKEHRHVMPYSTCEDMTRQYRNEGVVSAEHYIAIVAGLKFWHRMVDKGGITANASAWFGGEVNDSFVYFYKG